MRTPVLRLVGALVASLAFCQAMVFGPLVLFALHGLGLSDAGYGILLAVAAVGNVLGGMVAGRLDRRFGARILLPASGVVAAAAYAVCGAGDRAGAGRAPPSAPKRVAVAVGNVANLTLRQRIIPNELLGRVGNVVRFFIFGAMPLGALVGGFLVAWFGVRAPFAGAAAAATRRRRRPGSPARASAQAPACSARRGVTMAATEHPAVRPCPPVLSARSPCSPPPSLVVACTRTDGGARHYYGAGKVLDRRVCVFHNGHSGNRDPHASG